MLTIERPSEPFDSSAHGHALFWQLFSLKINGQVNNVSNVCEEIEQGKLNPIKCKKVIQTKKHSK